MEISKNLTDDAILREMGARVTHFRLARNLTQADLAREAGIAKRTLERIEAGGATQLLNLVRIFRALGLVENIGLLVPEPVLSPLALLKLKGKERRRASSARTTSPSNATRLVARQWQWGDSDSETVIDKSKSGQ